MRLRISLVLLLFAPSVLWGQDTFSIVAVDPVTGEVGSAGASCINGSIIISDVLPGRGAIHTQAFWNGDNQMNAHDRLVEGLSPQEVIDWLVANDAQGNPTIRQYGIADLSPENEPRTAAYTGVNTMDYKGHILGPNYAIQGNILLGPEILEDMESGFNGQPGTLAKKLMAALQGANVVGADTRCIPRGTSSRSAFIRVAKSHNSPDDLYLDLNIGGFGLTSEPIDELQAQFDEWLVDHDGDFNNDAFYNCADVDALVADIAAGTNTLSFDLTDDGLVNGDDLSAWLLEAGRTNLPSGNAYQPADANLDGGVDGQDFIAWNQYKFTATAAFCSGDFNANGFVDGNDFIIWNDHKFTTSAVPEPSSACLLALSTLALLVVRQPFQADGRRGSHCEQRASAFPG